MTYTYCNYEGQVNQYPARFGQTVEIVRPSVDATDPHPDNDWYWVRFPDGFVGIVAPEELNPIPLAGTGRCEGHPAGPFDPMGETVYCDGSCNR